MTDLEPIWRRLESWLETSAPHILAALAPPATLDQIADAEREIGWDFPDDLRASFLIHDGELVDAGCIAGLQLLPLADLVDDWRGMRKLLEGGAFEPLPDAEPSDFAAVRQQLAEIEQRARGQRRARTGVVVPSEFPELHGGHWNLSWIPIAATGGGDSFSLDLDPPAAGTVGQMFYFDHETGPTAIAAPSFTAWLTQYVEDLERGDIVLTSTGGLARRDGRRWR